MSEPVELLRQAAEAAPKVLPAAVAALAVRELKNGLWWLDKWSSLNDVDMEMFEATWGSLAREVLALAEQQQTRPAPSGDVVETVADAIARACIGNPVLGTTELARAAIAAMPQQARPDEATVYMARGIRPDSWLHEDRFAEFRHAYSYASAKTHAIPGLSKISAEEAYYVHRIIQHGFEFNERTKGDPRPGIKEES